MTSTLTVAECEVPEPDVGGTADLLDELAEYLGRSNDPHAVRLVRRARRRAASLRRDLAEIVERLR